MGIRTRGGAGEANIQHLRTTVHEDQAQDAGPRADLRQQPGRVAGPGRREGRTGAEVLCKAGAANIAASELAEMACDTVSYLHDCNKCKHIESRAVSEGYSSIPRLPVSMSSEPWPRPKSASVPAKLCSGCSEGLAPRRGCITEDMCASSGQLNAARG
eukprot:CAMPEP_0204012104 /NCGR_PEP_ID=MMETSP0360-20130528/23770_1 /ASSEMBLY_ACC=CAM_ASM_000342 /TAXON_ID=268821 /ORGANISM="Scrippsiella Hangoei, Strain SHTV-5" /LENGTH=157 /DNA_ID=CAMNT_0050954759 /DNA_START=48 /DNA_END=518 /DNA_ORIENTATION=+